MSTVRKVKFINYKIEPHTQLYASENSDYSIIIVSRSKHHAIIQGIMRTMEPIRTDGNGNEYIELKTDFSKQTYYAYSAFWIERSTVNA